MYSYTKLRQGGMDLLNEVKMLVIMRQIEEVEQQEKVVALSP